MVLSFKVTFVEFNVREFGFERADCEWAFRNGLTVDHEQIPKEVLRDVIGNDLDHFAFQDNHHFRNLAD